MNVVLETAVGTRPVRDVLERLGCPWCRGALEHGHEALRCADCARVFPIVEGIARLARIGSPEPEPGTLQPAPTSRAYQVQYERVADAGRYNESYRDLWSKRNSTRREHRLLGELLASQGRVGTLLDLPAGGGRLSAALEPHTELLIEADIALGQVQYGARNTRLARSPVRMTASAFHIPFRDGGVDASVCCRLCHHLPTPAEREHLVAELLRVSRRFVIMTFFDHDSLKNLLRRARRPFDGKKPKATLSIAQVRALGLRGGAELVACPALWTLFSGHRFALMVKRPS